jgi:hypothetical protein
MDRGSLKTQYRTVRMCPELFHDLFAELDATQSMVLFEVCNQAGWIADMLRMMGLNFKVANTNNPAWRERNGVRHGYQLTKLNKGSINRFPPFEPPDWPP